MRKAPLTLYSVYEAYFVLPSSWSSGQPQYATEFSKNAPAAVKRRAEQWAKVEPLSSHCRS